MKTILILASLLVWNTSAIARTYVAHVNHIANLNPQHQALNTLLQNDIRIDTQAKTVSIKFSQRCSRNNICPEMLKIYRLDIKKIDSKIVAAGMLPIQMNTTESGKVVVTLEKNENNSTTVKFQDQAGSSTLIASPIEETTLLF